MRKERDKFRGRRGGQFPRLVVRLRIFPQVNVNYSNEISFDLYSPIN